MEMTRNWVVMGWFRCRWPLGSGSSFWAFGAHAIGLPSRWKLGRDISSVRASNGRLFERFWPGLGKFAVSRCSSFIGISTCAHVWRTKGKAYESKYLKPTFKSVRSSLSVFRSIFWVAKSKLVILDDGARMNSQHYCNLILADQDGSRFHL